MGFKRVAIIGAECVSASIALALKAQEPAPEIVGYDANPVLSEIAREKGAFDRVERRPDRAVRADTDLVIISVPLGSLRDTLGTLAEHLPPGCLVTDTACLKASVMAWAAELLPEGVDFVGGHVVPNPSAVGLERLDDVLSDVDEASAGLLKGALYCFTPPAHTSSAVLNRLTELAALLGAQPFFVDVTEHDGLQAGIMDLPDLLSAALVRATIDTPGWQEMRKFAGARFAAATELDEERAEYRSALFLNRENLLLRLNGLLAELIRLRDVLTRGDAEALSQALADAAEKRANWIGETRRGLWSREDLPSFDDVPTSGERVSRLFVGEAVLERLRGPRDRRRP